MDESYAQIVDVVAQLKYAGVQNIKIDCDDDEDEDETSSVFRRPVQSMTTTT